MKKQSFVNRLHMKENTIQGSPELRSEQPPSDGTGTHPTERYHDDTGFTFTLKTELKGFLRSFSGTSLNNSSDLLF